MYTCTLNLQDVSSSNCCLPVLFFWKVLRFFFFLSFSSSSLLLLLLPTNPWNSTIANLTRSCFCFVAQRSCGALFRDESKTAASDDGDVNENGKKAISLFWTEKQQLCTCITLFCTFFYHHHLYHHCTTTTRKCLILRFVGATWTWRLSAAKRIRRLFSSSTWKGNLPSSNLRPKSWRYKR